MGEFPPVEVTSASTYRWLMAVPISFLAVAFITPDDFLGVLNTYSALGLTLSIFLPFAVVLLYTAGVFKKEQITLPNLLLANLMWVLFSLFLVYRTIVLFATEGAGIGAVMAITVGAAIISLIITFNFKWFSKKIVGMSNFGKQLTSDNKRLKETQEALDSSLRGLLSDAQTAKGAGAKNLVLKRMQDNLNQALGS